MTSVPTWRKTVALAAVLGLVAAACGDDDEGSGDDGGTREEASGTVYGEGLDLTSVCPDPLVVQTDWFPEPEHGGLYQVIGPDGDADAGAGTYTGPLGGTGIDLEV